MLHILFLLYIRAPLSVPLTMHIVNSINSICLHFNRSDSFIQWNQTDPAALSILTHLVPLVPSLQLIWLKPSVPKFPCPQFNHSNHYCTTFSIFIGTTNSNSFINSIDAINLIVFISSIPTARSISFNFDSILGITDCYHSYRCRLTQQNFSEKSGKIYTTGKHFGWSPIQRSRLAGQLQHHH